MELQRCANESYCLPDTPRVVSGLKASTADMFIDNAAYREFLFKEFGVSTVDEESAAVVMVSKLHNQTTLKGKIGTFHIHPMQSDVFTNILRLELSSAFAADAS